MCSVMMLWCSGSLVVPLLVVAVVVSLLWWCLWRSRTSMSAHAVILFAAAWRHKLTSTTLNCYRRAHKVHRCAVRGVCQGYGGMVSRWLAGIGNQGFWIRPGRGKLSRQSASCADEQPNAGAAAGAVANIKFCLMPAWRFAARNLPRSASVLPSLNSYPPWRGQCDFEYLAY